MDEANNQKNNNSGDPQELNLVSSSDAAKQIGCSSDHVARLCRQGELDCVRSDGRWQVNQVSLRSYAEAAEVRAEKTKARLSQERKAEFEKNQYIPSTEAARITGYTADHVARLCRQGELTCVQENGKWRVHRASLKTYQETLEKNNQEAAHKLSEERKRAYQESLQQHALRRLPLHVRIQHYLVPAKRTVRKMAAIALITFSVVQLAGYAGVFRAMHIGSPSAEQQVASIWFPFSLTDTISDFILNEFFFYTPPPLVERRGDAQRVTTNTGSRYPAGTVINNVTNNTTNNTFNFSGVSEGELGEKLAELEKRVTALIPRGNFSGAPRSTSVNTQTFAQSQRIDSLDGVTITNATITGGSISGTSGVGVSSFAALSDVSVSSPAYGDLVYYDGSDWSSIATSSLGISGTSQWSGTTNISFTAGNVGIGTTSPYAPLSVVGEIVGGYFTGTTTATSTLAGGLDVGAINQTGSATSTFASGIDLANGCFSVNGTCITGSGGGGGASFGQAFEFIDATTLAPTTTNSGVGVQTDFFTATSTTVDSTFTRLVATNATTTNATTTNLAVTSTASTSDLTVSNNFTFGAVSGFLKATAGTVATALIDLTSDITGILSAANGGTGWGNIQANTLLLGNGTNQLATTSAGTNGQILSLVGGVPSWVATTTFSGGLTYSGGNVTADLGTDISAAEIADGDHGDFTYSSGSATLDTDSVSDNEIDYTTVTLADFTNDANFITSAFRNFSLTTNTFGQSALAPTTTQNLAISGTGTSTFAGGLEAWRQIAAPYFHATSSATSTLPQLDAIGIQVSTHLDVDGSFAFNGVTGTAWSDFCVSITGSASLCDGSDAVGSGGNGLATSTDIADTYVIYGTSASDVGAEAAFTYDDSTDKLTVVNASTTRISASYASSTSGFFGALSVGALDGPLAAQNGSVSATSSISSNYIENLSGSNTGDITLAGALDYLTIVGQTITRNAISLVDDITGILSAANGGTGWGNIQANTLLLGNGTNQLATTSAGTNGQILSLVGGVPSWVATTTFSGGLTYSGGNVTADLGTSIDISDETNLVGDSEIVLTDDTLSIATSIARDSELHDAVTLAGAPNYLTLSGQEITLTVLDISDDTNLSVSASGLELSGDAIALTTGYTIPLTASTTNWNTFYDTPSNRITAGTGLSWVGNTLNAEVQTSDLADYLTFADWYATTTDGLAEGGTNLYFTTARATVNFISNLAATTSVDSITTLANLSITESQITDLSHYTDTDTNAYLHASTTIPKTYTANTFTGAQTLNGGLTIGSLTGPLAAQNGSVSATSSISSNYIENLSGSNTGDITLAGALDYLTIVGQTITRNAISLVDDITGILSAANGGTGWGNIQANTLLLGNGTNQLATTSAGTNGQILSLVGGVPSWVATTTFSSPLNYSSGSVSLDTSGTWSGNAGTATALAANGANCSSGNAPLGIDTSGAAEGCFDVWTEAENTAAAYIALTDLSASWPLSYNSGTGAFTWSGLATSSNLSSGQVLYATGANTFESVATSSITYDSTLTTSGTAGYIIGGSGFTIGVATTTNSLFTGSAGQVLAYLNGGWTGVATTTFSGGLTYSGGNVTSDLGTAIDSSEITNDSIVNADINSAAAIAYSKLNLSSSIQASDIADGDHGDFTYSSGSATLDNDVVGADEIADADYGDFTFSAGTATLDASTVSDNEIDYTTVTLGDFTNDANFISSGFRNWIFSNGYLAPTTTAGIIVSASSTIGAGTQAGGLTVLGGATTTGTILVQGTGTSTFSGSLDIDGEAVFANGNDIYWEGSGGTPTSVLELSGDTTFLRGGGGTPTLRIDASDGSNLMTFLEGGNVGIGTTSPGTLLSLGDTGNDTINISATATSTFGSGINIRSGCFAVNGTCVTGGGSSISFGTDNQIPFTNSGGTDFDYSANFTFDGSLLTIAGNVELATGADREIGVADSATGNAGNNLSIFAGTAATNPSPYDGGTVFIYGGSGNAVGGADGDVVLGHDGTSSIGNVGIGTTSPYAKLSVVGETVSSYFTATTSATSTLPQLDATGIQVASTLDIDGNLSFDGVTGTAWSDFCVSITGSADLCDGSDDGAGGSSFGQAWEIDGSGNLAPTTTQTVYTPTYLGVGTSSPFAKLAVNPVAGDTNQFVVGSSTATSFIINDAGDVGIGTASPEAQFHAQKTSAGLVGASVDWAFEDSTPELAIIGGSGNTGILGFGDDASSKAGRFEYDHSADQLGVFTSGVERLTIDSSGRIGIGTTTPDESLVISDRVNTNLATFSFDGLTSTGGNPVSQIISRNTVSGVVQAEDATYIKTVSDVDQGRRAYNLVFGTGQNGTVSDQLTIDWAGNVGIGTNSTSITGTSLSQLVVGDGTGDEGIVVNVGSSGIGRYAFGEAGSVSSVGGAIAYDASTGVLSFQTGGLFDQVTIATNGIVHSSNNIYVGQESTSNPALNDVDGSAINSAGFVSVNRASSISGFFGRGNDGELVRFYSAGSNEGNISVSGTTVSYNAFTGSHYGTTTEALERGMLVALTGEPNFKNGNIDAEPTYGITQSTEENASNILGSVLTLLEPTHERSDENPYLVMAVGNGNVWVVQGDEETLEPGDYLITSSEPGHAVKDSGKFTVAHVVARAAQTVDWSTVTDTTTDGKKRQKISVTFEQFDKVHDSIASLELPPQEEVAAFFATTTDAETTFAVREVVRFLFAGVKELYALVADNAAKIAALSDQLLTKEVHVSNQLCIGETCINEAELQELLALRGQVAQTASAPAGAHTDGTSGESTDTEAPVITINGNNPAQIEVGASYADLGASVNDNVDQNLGLDIFVDGVEVTTVHLDTASSTTYEIVYRATDQAGNVGEAVRTVIVGDAVIETTTITESVENNTINVVLDSDTIEEAPTDETVAAETDDQDTSSEEAASSTVSATTTPETGSE